MRQIKVRFEEDQKEEDIDVLIHASSRDEEVESLIRRISGTNVESLIVTGSDGTLVKLEPEKIILISVNGNMVRIETDIGSFKLRETLHNIEKRLSGGSFLRISRSEIINMDKAVKFDFTIKGELRVELSGGIETWVSRRYFPAVRRKIRGKE